MAELAESPVSCPAASLAALACNRKAFQAGLTFSLKIEAWQIFCRT